MASKFFSLLRRATRYVKELRDLHLIRASGLFDETWYLSENADVAQANINPLIHYLRYGGLEGRDPGPDFRSSDYLFVYHDVKAAGINPLVHYLKHGQDEGRQARPVGSILEDAIYQCSVCKNRIHEFLPIDPIYEETRKKYGNPYTFDDAETINPSQYTCPLCGASDRDRIYALYLEMMLRKVPSDLTLVALDIAPSNSLTRFLRSYSNVFYKSADKYMDSVDYVIDITNMDTIVTCLGNYTQVK